MKKVKFPRTRRDKFIEHQKQLKEEREWWEKYMQQRQTAGRKAKLKRLFEAESQLPLATNEDSWSEATFARPGLPRPWGRLQQQQNGAEADRGPQSPVTEGDDDVFLDDPDRRGPGHVGLYVDGLDSRDPVSPKSGRSTPETLRSCAISWVVDDVDTVHTLSDHNQGPTYDYTDTGVVSAATTIDVLCYLWGIGSYLWDVGSDLALAYKYYSMGHIVWFSLTLFFVLAPALCMTTFSLTLYIRDHVICGEKASAHRWVPRTFFLILQLAPLWRALETAFYACRSCSSSNHEKKARFYRQMLLEDIDSMLLRLFEAFLEAAPQLVLQLYICTQIGLEGGATLVLMQIFSLLSSWLTVAWTLVGFQRALRLSHYPLRAPLTRLGMAAQFMWRLFTVAARVLALTMFASYFKAFVFVFVGVHWLLMLMWVCMQHTDYCTMQSTSGQKHHSFCLEMLFRIMTAFVHIFCFFNLIDGHTRLRAITFYTLIYLENATMVLAWYSAGATEFEQTWYHVPVFLMVFVGFLLGIVFMLLYYTQCHPNQYSDNPRHQKVKPCVSWSQLSLFRDVNAVVDSTRSETDNSSYTGLQGLPLGRSTPNGFPSPEYATPPSMPGSWGDNLMPVRAATPIYKPGNERPVNNNYQIESQDNQLLQNMRRSDSTKQESVRCAVNKTSDLVSARSTAEEPVEFSRPMTSKCAKPTRPTDKRPVEPTRPTTVKSVEPTRSTAVRPVEPTRPTALRLVETTRPTTARPVEPPRPTAVKLVEPTRPRPVPRVEPTTSTAVRSVESTRPTAVRPVEPSRSIAVNLAEHDIAGSPVEAMSGALLVNRPPGLAVTGNSRSEVAGVPQPVVVAYQEPSRTIKDPTEQREAVIPSVAPRSNKRRRRARRTATQEGNVEAPISYPMAHKVTTV